MNEMCQEEWAAPRNRAAVPVHKKTLMLDSQAFQPPPPVRVKAPSEPPTLRAAAQQGPAQQRNTAALAALERVDALGPSKGGHAAPMRGGAKIPPGSNNHSSTSSSDDTEGRGLNARHVATISGQTAASRHDEGRKSAHDMLTRPRRHSRITAAGKQAELESPLAAAEAAAPDRSKFEYKILRKVGTGGMGEVYEGLMTQQSQEFGSVRRRVALKFMIDEEAKDPELQRRFIDECRLSMRLSHGNIVRFYDVAEFDNRLALVMEFVDGVSLYQALSERPGRPLPLATALLVTTEILRAVDYIHRQRDAEGTAMNLAHGDISPSNILLSREGEVKVSDFGITKSAMQEYGGSDGGDEFCTVMGKLPYVAPEQLRGGDINQQTDLYAVGAVLYEMLSGDRMVTGENTQELVQCIQLADYTPFRVCRPDLGDELARIVDKALAANPDDRFASAAEMSEALLRYASKRGTALIPTSLRELVDCYSATNPHRTQADNPRSRNINIHAQGKSLVGNASIDGLMPWPRFGGASAEGAERVLHLPAPPPIPEGALIRLDRYVQEEPDFGLNGIADRILYWADDLADKLIDWADKTRVDAVRWLRSRGKRLPRLSIAPGHGSLPPIRTWPHLSMLARVEKWFPFGRLLRLMTLPRIGRVPRIGKMLRFDRLPGRHSLSRLKTCRDRLQRLRLPKEWLGNKDQHEQEPIDFG